MSKTLVFFIFLFLFYNSSFAQLKEEKQWGIWNAQTQEASKRLEALKTIIWEKYLFSKPDTALVLVLQHHDFAKARGLKKHLGSSFNMKGILFHMKGDVDSAIVSWQKCKDIYEEVDYQQGVSSAMGNTGNAHFDLGDYKTALKIYQKNLTSYKQNGNRKGLINVLNNIGLIYSKIEDTDKALNTHNEALNVSKEIGYERGVVNALINLGTIYQHQSHYEVAIEHYSAALKAFKTLNNKRGEANALINIGVIYALQGDYYKGLEFCKKGLKVSNDGGFKSIASQSYFEIGAIYKYKKVYGEAVINFKKALQIAQEIKAQEKIKNNLKALWEVYELTKQDKNAYEIFKLYIQAKDSLKNDEVKKVVLVQNIRDKFLLDSISMANNIREKGAKIILKEKENLISIYISVIVIALFAIIAIIFYTRNKKNHYKLVLSDKENILLSLEKEQKNKEITSKELHIRTLGNLTQSIIEKLTEQIPAFDIEGKRIIKRIIKDLESTSREKIITQFDSAFLNLSADFYKNLIDDFPELTETERRLCAYIRLNFKNDDIIELTGKSSTSVRSAKYRISKKMGIHNTNTSIYKVLLKY